MAAVVLKEGQELDCSDVYQQVANYLPAYARPRFIRIQVRRHRLTLHPAAVTSAALLDSSQRQSCEVYYSGFVCLSAIRQVEAGGRLDLASRFCRDTKVGVGVKKVGVKKLA